MRRVCCICLTVFGFKEPFDRDEETHGFCPDCFEIEMMKIESLKEKERRENEEMFVGGTHSKD